MNLHDCNRIWYTKKDQVDSFGPRPQYKNLEKKLGLSILDVDRLSISINIYQATQFFFGNSDPSH